jgi:hypothetical protein
MPLMLSRSHKLMHCFLAGHVYAPDHLLAFDLQHFHCYCFNSGRNLIYIVAWRQLQLLHPQSLCSCAQMAPPR